MIPNQWYAILESDEVKTRKPIGVTRMGEKLVAWRDTRGMVTVMSDKCPHRGVQLSVGVLKGDCIQCPYHGWKWDMDGSLVDACYRDDYPEDPVGRIRLIEEERRPELVYRGGLVLRRGLGELGHRHGRHRRAICGHGHGAGRRATERYRERAGHVCLQPRGRYRPHGRHAHAERHLHAD